MKCLKKKHLIITYDSSGWLTLWMTTAPLGNIPIYTLIIKEDILLFFNPLLIIYILRLSFLTISSKQ